MTPYFDELVYIFQENIIYDEFFYKSIDKNKFKVYNINRKWGTMIKNNLLEVLHEMEEVTKTI